MKKSFFFILFFAFSAFSFSSLFAQEMTCSNNTDGNGISIGLSLNSFDVSPISYRGETMHEIVGLSGIFIPNDEGMPNLPRFSRFVAVPKDAQVRVSIVSMETETLPNVNIAPALRIQAIPEEPVTDYVKNDKVYSENAFYPLSPVEVSDVSSIRGVNVVMVGITPFQFNPVTKELVVISNIELALEFVGGAKEFGDAKYRSPWFDPILRNAVLNYEAIPDMEYAPKTSRDGSGCEYLIVLPNRDDFMPFAEQIKEYRTKQGIYTKIMTLAEMGVSNTVQLKTFFHNAFNTWDIPPVAVLLMADHFTDMNVGIPGEVISHPYSGSCITDNQYSDVTGNLLPDMVFGRMAAENPAQMEILVSKFFEYDAQPCMDPAYYQNPITALGWQTVRWFQICSEVVGGYWRNQGKTPVRINAIYEGTPGSQWSTAQNTAQVVNYFGPTSNGGTGYLPATPSELGGWSGGLASHVVTALNNGAFALQHRDHGFWQGWGEPAFTISNIYQLTNVGKMSYLFTINCETGKFNNNPPCFGEEFHRYRYNGQNAGVVGFLGPTEVSYSFVNDAYAWGMYDLYDPNFMPTYGPGNGYGSGSYVGYSGNWMPAFGNVSGKYFLYSSAWPYNTSDKNITYQMFTAHSDVFLRLYTEVPNALDVSHAEVALAGNPNFLISANEGTLIALSAEIDDELVILDVATATGGTQTMTIPSTLLTTTVIHVVVTGQNFLRYEADVSVVPAEGAYIVPMGYTVIGAEKLTYTSVNQEIEVTLKNVGVAPTAGQLNVNISTNDPQLTINNPSATCGIINPDGTATVRFKVTVANEIEDNKSFSVDVNVSEAKSVWSSRLSLKAFAPKFKLEKVLINGIEGGTLAAGSVVNIVTTIKNIGGADAYNVKGELDINSPYVELACPDGKRAGVDLPEGENMELPFIVITSPDMPYGYVANFQLSLTANYNRSFESNFTATNSGSSAYCMPGSSNCSTYNDRISSLFLAKTSDQSNPVINNPSPTCNSNGYTDYTSTMVDLIPGEQYIVKVKVGYANHRVKGWVDFNGNNTFEESEALFSIACAAIGTEYSATFTVPATNIIPGDQRFRIRTRDGGTVPGPCDTYSYGQTLDYTAVLPEMYPRVQNVVAEIIGNDIAINWEAPEAGTQNGYNIYKEGAKLNETLLTETNFVEENISKGVYAYQVKAVYDDNKESFGEMSNVICVTAQFCEKPVELSGVAEENNAVLAWNEPENIDGELLGYNIYRDDEKIGETDKNVKEYTDYSLLVGSYVYKVSALYEHCVESELTDGITVGITVGVNENSMNSYQLFPNPANNNIIVKGNGLIAIEIFDMHGRLLAEYVNISDNSQLNVSKYENGVYFVKMYSVNNQFVTKRLVIIK